MRTFKLKKSSRSLLLPLALLCMSALGQPAWAEDKKTASGEDGWESVQTQMVMPGEGFAGNQLVAAAYGFIWLMVAGFVWTVWRRTEALQKEMDGLRARVERGIPPSSPSSSLRAGKANQD